MGDDRICPGPVPESPCLFERVGGALVLTVVITVKTVAEDENHPVGEGPVYRAEGGYRRIEGSSVDRDRAVNHVKGATLCAVAHRDLVPDQVRFVVRDA